jgi:hypothetical protein
VKKRAMLRIFEEIIEHNKEMKNPINKRIKQSITIKQRG